MVGLTGAFASSAPSSVDTTSSAITNPADSRDDSTRFNRGEEATLTSSAKVLTSLRSSHSPRGSDPTVGITRKDTLSSRDGRSHVNDSNAGSAGSNSKKDSDSQSFDKDGSKVATNSQQSKSRSGGEDPTLAVNDQREDRETEKDGVRRSKKSSTDAIERGNNRFRLLVKYDAPNIDKSSDIDHILAKKRPPERLPAVNIKGVEAGISRWNLRNRF